MKYLVKISVFLLVVEFKGLLGRLPPNTPTCRRSDPNISECIVRAIQVLTPRLVSGDLGGGYRVPPLEPFVIKELNWGEERGLMIHLTNVNIRGTTSYNIQKFRFNPKDLKFDVIVVIPMLDIQAKYRMNINFLGGLLDSSGDYFTQYKGSKIRIQGRLKKNNKKGVDSADFEPFVVKFDRGSVANLKITNLFGGNKVLNEVVHNFILHNDDSLIKSLYPAIERELSKQFTAIADKVVEHSSLEEALPN